MAVGASPGAYRRWLGELARQALERAARTEPLVFVNAWNEWAEGTHLEPDGRYGRGLAGAAPGQIGKQIGGG